MGRQGQVWGPSGKKRLVEKEVGECMVLSLRFEFEVLKVA